MNFRPNPLLYGDNEVGLNRCFSNLGCYQEAFYEYSKLEGRPHSQY